MSRRRKLPPLPEGYTPAFVVAVVCTDRGQHAEAGLAKLGEFVDVAGTVAVLWQQTERGAPVTDWRPADGSKTFRFTCRRCGRDARLREPNVIAAMEALRPDSAPLARPVLNISLIC